MPTWANDHITRPEQSKPEGEAPAHTYGTPIWPMATPAAAEAEPLAGGGAADDSAPPTSSELEEPAPVSTVVSILSPDARAAARSAAAWRARSASTSLRISDVM